MPADLKDLSFASIRRIIEEEEAPLRCRTFPPEAVRKVFRYGAIIGQTIEHHKRLDRGMEQARRLIRKAEDAGSSFPSGTVILADEMIQSKGRFTRPWHAPRGGIWLTLALVNTLLPERGHLFPMAAGVACCELLRSCGIEAKIKWVNDVRVNGKKIVGILTESFTGLRFGEEYILVGIGINVNNSRFPDDFSEQATSMQAYFNREFNRQELVLKLLAKLSWNIGLLHYEEALHLENHGTIGKDFDGPAENINREPELLLKSYANLTDIFQRRVLFGFNVRENPQFEARVIGLDNSGGLLLELDDKSRVVQYSGEILYLD